MQDKFFLFQHKIKLPEKENNNQLTFRNKKADFFLTSLLKEHLEVLLPPGTNGLPSNLDDKFKFFNYISLSLNRKNFVLFLVYFTVNNKSASINDFAKNLNLTRPTIYSIIDELSHMGLISKKKEKNRKYYYGSSNLLKIFYKLIESLKPNDFSNLTKEKDFLNYWKSKG